MAIIGIVAVDRRGAIGKAGGLPWHYKVDLRFFKEQTTDHVCVMGRRTWASLSAPLPNRLNIILSHHLMLEPQASVICLRNALEILSLAPYLVSDIFIIGGASIYRTFFPAIERWIVTEVPLTVEDADTFMPAGYLDGFALTATQELADALVVKFYARMK
ncbi:MAG: dihydrofolate reductase [Pyrinomonadaceae bacterium]|nr:dihydrofolate reductase [Pyrinomonadaceae bacterium]